MAVEHWPQNAEIWRTRVPYLIYTGRPRDALEMLREDAERPTEISDDFVRAMRATAEAIAGQRQTGWAVEEVLKFLRGNPPAALRVANACTALGVLDDAFAIFEGYYLGTGRWASVAPAAGDADRQTSALFLPPMKPAWRDPRFGELVQRIGLEDYWRQSGSVPDFRRTGG
jgi:hypothetical protein